MDRVFWPFWLISLLVSFVNCLLLYEIISHKLTKAIHSRSLLITPLPWVASQMASLKRAWPNRLGSHYSQIIHTSIQQSLIFTNRKIYSKSLSFVMFILYFDPPAFSRQSVPLIKAISILYAGGKMFRWFVCLFFTKRALLQHQVSIFKSTLVENVRSF